MQIRAVADGGFPQPIVVFNTAHSGSRLLARLLMDAGVYMGTNLSETLDCDDLVPLVEAAVLSASGAYPIGAELDDAETLAIAEKQFAAHLGSATAGQRWGWKLCETVLILPLIERYFPGAVYIHLVRDGRDVAFSPFVAPKSPYWRKVYFGSDAIVSWRGFPMTQRAYRAYGYLFNAARWRYHVDLALAFSSGLGPRYIEVRYEDLAHRYEETRARLLAALGLPPSSEPPSEPVRSGSVAKWRRQPARRVRRILDIVEPTLSALGYSEPGARTSCKTAGLIERLLLGGRV